MKRIMSVILLSLLVTMGNMYAQAFYTGDGGRSITLAVLEPAGANFAKEDMWILPLVQGAFNTNFNRYSAIRIIDRQNLDSILAQQQESISGNYSESDYISIGRLTNARYILIGTITKTPNSLLMLGFSVSDVQAGNRIASYGPKPFAVSAVENLSAIQEASADLLEQLGVQLTDTGKRSLLAAADDRHIQAETALSKGIAAQRGGTVVEAFAYFLQAVNYDPASAEIVSRLDIVNSDITSSSMGEDIRNAIAWRRAWVARLSECDQFVANYARNTPLTTTLIYSADFKQGDIDWDKETIPINVDVCLVPNESWPLPITGVVNAVYEGFAGTGQIAAWRLDWPLKSVTGLASQVMPSREVRYNLVVDLLNDKGAVLGRQAVTVTAGWRIEFRDGKSVAVITQTPQTITYPAVNANNISETLAIRVTSINGRIVSAGTGDSVAVRAMSGEDYKKTVVVGTNTYPGGWAVMPEGEFFIQTANANDGFNRGFWDLNSTTQGAQLGVWENRRENDHYYHFVPIGDGWYKIAFRQSGRLVLDVTGGQDRNGVAIQAYEDNGSTAQRFRFRRTSDGFYKIYTYWGRTIHTQRGAQDSLVHTWEELPDNHRDTKNQLWRLVKP
jgi:hypothetical protein